MEASALNHTASPILPALAGRSPLLRLKSDEQLIVLIRRGQHGAFEALVQRYQSRLLAFCRHMLGSTEDAEDVLQEVFAAAFNAMIADSRPINARPWLYRIARNRCLNHLRRPQHSGQDSMDVFERDGGLTTADAVYKREEFRQIVADVQDLPETQKTALLLREIDALSYDQIAEAMDTTVPSVKSLLVRARVSLAEAAEARLLTCDEVRLELGEVAEGLAKTTAPVRRHLKTCERCRTFRTELRKANRALAAVYPLGPLIVFKKLFIGKLGLTAGGTAGNAGAGVASGVGGVGSAGAMAGGAAAAGGAGAGGFVSAGISTLATKAAAGLAAAALVTAAGVEAQQVVHPDPGSQAARTPAQIAAAPPVAAPVAPRAVASRQQLAQATPVKTEPAAIAGADAAREQKTAQANQANQADPAATPPVDPTTATPAQPTPVTGQQQPPVLVQEDSSTVAIQEGSGAQGTGSGHGAEDWNAPGESSSPSGTSSGSTQPQTDSGSTGPTTPPPGESTGTPPAATPAPVAGERGPSRGLRPRGRGSRKQR
jgi:RNA polymerase sigma factor (sigma-70 family)